MKKNLLNHYVVDLLKSIEQNLSFYIKDQKPEFLHHLRVDIKKIKAVLSFTEKIYKEKHNAAKLKPLFKKAGEIREMQINIHLLSLFTQPPDRLIEKLKKKENILTRKFIKHGSRYFRLMKIFRKNVCLPEMLPDKKTINEYFESEKQKINKKFKNRESAHRYRVKIKKIMYIYNALPKKIQENIELNEVEINKQQENLGDWHDTFSAINFLSQKHFSSKTAELVVRLKEKEKMQFKALFK